MFQPSTQRLGLPALLSVLMLAVILLPTIVHGRRTSHCYTCRSRGQLGDCRDPFPYNETTADGVRGVDATPCASKWCGKLIEGRDDGHGRLEIWLLYLSGYGHTLMKVPVFVHGSFSAATLETGGGIILEALNVRGCSKA
ncbi:hypothetical protein IscW_ISCW004015 [Ixodes scapularis]|uniref:Protein quiver n=1 Tax=Ixodes scapularis TaxID=6945 RepID=B7PGH0_IXOSC|nr:hypothetical protein IscW_ISCW004015 [Ixodes scapularis]|eukprot:XP_002434292.1 hypothetical protein IscW_ISCW004015 [Ixodes scapularis]